MLASCRLLAPPRAAAWKPPLPSGGTPPHPTPAVKLPPVATAVASGGGKRRPPRTRLAALSSSSSVTVKNAHATGTDDGEVDEDGHGYYWYRGHRVHFERHGHPTAGNRTILFLHGGAAQVESSLP